MGTRADFYVGTGPKAEWLGSVAWDGYAWADEKGSPIAKARTEPAFRKAVAELLARREDATLPKDGWPWPWEDSRTTDYTYYFSRGRVRHDIFGRRRKDWPNMKAIQKVKLGGPGSGLIVIAMGQKKGASG